MEVLGGQGSLFKPNAMFFFSILSVYVGWKTVHNANGATHHLQWTFQLTHHQRTIGPAPALTFHAAIETHVAEPKYAPNSASRISNGLEHGIISMIMAVVTAMRRAKPTSDLDSVRRPPTTLYDLVSEVMRAVETHTD